MIWLNNPSFPLDENTAREADFLPNSCLQQSSLAFRTFSGVLRTNKKEHLTTTAEENA